MRSGRRGAGGPGQGDGGDAASARGADHERRRLPAPGAQHVLLGVFAEVVHAAYGHQLHPRYLARGEPGSGLGEAATRARDVGRELHGLHRGQRWLALRSTGREVADQCRRRLRDRRTHGAGRAGWRVCLGSVPVIRQDRPRNARPSCALLTRASGVMRSGADPGGARPRRCRRPAPRSAGHPWPTGSGGRRGRR